MIEPGLEEPARRVDWADLAGASDGMRVAVTGRAYQVMGVGDRILVQLVVVPCPPPQRCAVRAEAPPGTAVGPSDWVRIVGTVAASEEIVTETGATVALPRIEATHVAVLADPHPVLAALAGEIAAFAGEARAERALSGLDLESTALADGDALAGRLAYRLFRELGGAALAAAGPLAASNARDVRSMPEHPSEVGVPLGHFANVEALGHRVGDAVSACWRAGLGADAEVPSHRRDRCAARYRRVRAARDVAALTGNGFADPTALLFEGGAVMEGNGVATDLRDVAFGELLATAVVAGLTRRRIERILVLALRELVEIAGPIRAR